MRLNLGCGQHPMTDWTNVDWIAGPGVDLVLDLEDDQSWNEAGLATDSVGQVYASHLIEHIRDPLAMMENLHRVCKPGAVATFACPYGSSDDADEDPTHVRRMFINSWAYFAQPIYWRGNTDYIGDWQLAAVELRVTPESWSRSATTPDHNRSLQHLFQRTMRERNVITEMIAIMQCVKPIRERDRNLQGEWQLAFDLIEPEREPVRLGGLMMKGMNPDA